MLVRGGGCKERSAITPAVRNQILKCYNVQTACKHRQAVSDSYITYDTAVSVAKLVEELRDLCRGDGV